MGSSRIETVESYTYLGLTLHMNGSMSTAVYSLRTKALRAMFALRKYVDRTNLSFRSLMNLFDALIKPILSYGAAIWGPLQPVSSALLQTFDNQTNTTVSLRKLLDKVARDPSETIQLKYLKWAFGVHKYASNLGCWGDSGRLPIIDFGVRQALKYLKRVEQLPQHLLVKKALEDQKTHHLSWYTSLNAIRIHIGETAAVSIKEPLKEVFQAAWQSSLQNQTKLDFYRNIKPVFNSTPEGYLSVLPKYEHRATITRLRISSHQLAIETGRYEGLERSERLCATCDMGMVDSEQHFLASCSSINAERVNLRRSLRIQDHSVLLDAISVFSLTSAKPKDLDDAQIEHLQQICKIVHKMYEQKLKNLEELRKEDINAEDDEH